MERTRNVQLPESREEILKLFERYGFKDELGHPLTRCVDFLALVDAACAGRKEEGEK
jgi:hypothetical protein